MRFEAKNVEEAKAQACIKLEKTLKELDIEIISEGSKGFLGIGSKNAIIEVFEKGKKKIEKPKKEVEVIEKPVDKELKAKKTIKKVEKAQEVKNKSFQSKEVEIKQENRIFNYEKLEKFEAYDKLNLFLQELLKKMEITATLDITQNEEKEHIYVNINTDNSTMVIGKRGVVLEALQTLVNTALIPVRGQYWIKLDCDDYRGKRLNTVKGLAQRTAYKVKKYKKRAYIDNLSSSERKLVHSLLSSDKEIETHSEGKEPYRKLVVSYKR